METHIFIIINHIESVQKGFLCVAFSEAMNVFCRWSSNSIDSISDMWGLDDHQQTSS